MNRPRHVERLLREPTDCQCCTLYLAGPSSEKTSPKPDRAIDICYRCQRDICDRCLGANSRWHQVCHQCHWDEASLKETGERLYDYPLRPINLARVRGSGPLQPPLAPLAFQSSLTASRPSPAVPPPLIGRRGKGTRRSRQRRAHRSR